VIVNWHIRNRERTNQPLWSQSVAGNVSGKYLARLNFSPDVVVRPNKVSPPRVFCGVKRDAQILYKCTWWLGVKWDVKDLHVQNLDLTLITLSLRKWDWATWKFQLVFNNRSYSWGELAHSLRNIYNSTISLYKYWNVFKKHVEVDLIIEWMALLMHWQSPALSNCVSIMKVMPRPCHSDA
jgi:hypothetical protein